MPVLPFELIPIVLSYLTQKELYECMNVCRLWYSEASSIFYKELKWRDSRNEKLLELIKKPLMNGKEIGDYAIKIEFLTDYHPYMILERHEFETVIDNLYKLEVIYANTTYINYLHDIPAYNLNQLQEISLDDSHSEGLNVARIHYLANKRLENQITTLKLSFGGIAVGVDRGAIMRDLSSFTRLRKLVIFGHSHPLIVNQEHLIAFVLKTCHNLTCLEVHSNRKWSMNRAINVRHMNLASIKLSLPELSPRHLKCIMHCAPNLKEFRFEANGYFYQNMSYVEDKSKLISFLKKLEYLEVSTEATMSESSISIPFFWDFWKKICGEKCYCDLDATIARYGHGSYETTFVKESQHLKAACLVGVEATDNNYWANRMKFLTFDVIRLANEQRDLENIEYDGYLDLVPPVLRLLRQQRQICAIDIEYNNQVVYFDSVPRESKELFDKGRKRSEISHGYIREYVLENEMLNYLSTLYPSIEHLTLKDCLPAQENSNDNIHHIDLTRFNKIQQLECDFDSLFDNRGMIVPKLYIQLIDMSGVSVYFYYDERKSLSIRYFGRLKPNEIVIPFKNLLVKIHLAHITQFVFKRYGEVVSVIS